MNQYEQKFESGREAPPLELPVEVVEAFSKLGIEREKISFLGLMRNRTYRVEIKEGDTVKTYVYKEIRDEHGRSLSGVLQDRNASTILERLGYPTRKLIALEPETDPHSAIYDFVAGRRGGTSPNEL